MKWLNYHAAWLCARCGCHQPTCLHTYTYARVYTHPYARVHTHIHSAIVCMLPGATRQHGWKQTLLSSHEVEGTPAGIYCHDTGMTYRHAAAAAATGKCFPPSTAPPHAWCPCHHQTSHTTCRPTAHGPRAADAQPTAHTQGHRASCSEGAKPRTPRLRSLAVYADYN